jgi:hypothetical protein
MELAEPTFTTSNFRDWHRRLCEIARTQGGSASTEQAWMHRLYNEHYTPSEAWEAFNNNEIGR